MKYILWLSAGLFSAVCLGSSLRAQELPQSKKESPIENVLQRLRNIIQARIANDSGAAEKLSSLSSCRNLQVAAQPGADWGSRFSEVLISCKGNNANRSVQSGGEPAPHNTASGALHINWKLFDQKKLNIETDPLGKVYIIDQRTKKSFDEKTLIRAIYDVQRSRRLSQARSNLNKNGIRAPAGWQQPVRP